MKLKKIDRVDISLKQLIDVDSSTGITRCVDCISNGMILMASVSKNVSVRDSFVFKNLSDIVKGTNGILTSVVNGILTLSVDPNAISAETALSELSDVAITGLANNDYLVYNSVSKKWENSQGSFVPTTRHITINGVTQDLSTNRTWTISSGTVTSVTGTGTVSGLTLTGTVTTTGSLTLGGTLTLTSGNVTTALGFTPYNATNPAGYITSSALTNYVTNSSLTSTLTNYVTSTTLTNTISGLSSVYQPIFITDNGLTYGSGYLKLGGQLSQNTTIDGKDGGYSLSLLEMSQLTLQASDLVDTTEINLTPTQMQIKTPLYGSASAGDVLTILDPTTGEAEWQTPPSGSGGGPLYGAATQASAGVYTVTITGAPTYTAGDTYVIKFDTVNDGASTLNINGQGAKNIYKNTDFPIASGDIKANQVVELVYDGTNFQAIGLISDQLLAYVSNDEGAVISKGQAVYAYQASGNRMSVKLARADQDATSAKTIGLVYDTTIGVGASGYIIIQGVIEGVNTGSFSAGNTLYLSGSTFGGLTATKPSAPTHLVYVGIVERANAGNGQIYVRTQNGYELDEIHDVDLVTTAPVNNDVLVFDTSTTPDLWKPKSIPTILGYTPVTNARTISTSAPLSGGGDLTADRTLSISQATTSTDGYLSSSDWNSFNAKSSAGNLTYFGDGSTGVVTINTNNATLLADTYYQDLTITGSGSLNCKGFRVFVSGTLDLTGAGANGICQNGLVGASSGGFGGGTNGTSAGKLGFGRTVYGGVETASGIANEIVGGNGGSSATGNGLVGGTATAAAINNYRVGGAGGSGGKGGNGAGGTGGNGSAGQVNGNLPNSGYIPLIRNIGVYGLFSHVELSPSSGAGNSTLVYPGLNGGGGGGGAGNAASGGGGGGAGGGGGGNLYIYAKTVSIGGSTNSAAICANGAAGGNGGGGAQINNNTGGGGGGAGGGGGYVFLLCNSITGGNFTFISANGGSGGNGGDGRGTGIGAQGGTGGSGGRITVIRISDGTITQVNGTTNAGTTPTAPTTGTAGGAGGAGGTCTYTA